MNIIEKLLSNYNQRLIAQSTYPEMLEALIEIVSMVEKGVSIDIIHEPLYKLIEKTTGKSWEEIKELINE